MSNKSEENKKTIKINKSKLIFAKRLQGLRHSLNIKAELLATMLGITTRTYFHYEETTRTTMPTYDNIIKLSRIFDCTIDYLLGETDNPDKENK